MVQHIYKWYILDLKCSKAHESTTLPVTLCSLTIDVTQPRCACTAPAPALGSSLWGESTRLAEAASIPGILRTLPVTENEVEEQHSLGAEQQPGTEQAMTL